MPLAAGLLLAAWLPAQGEGSQRVPLEPDAKGPSPQLEPGAGVLLNQDGATNGVGVSATMGFDEVDDDLPDFAPGRDVTDEQGNIVKVEPAGDPYVLSFTGGDYKPGTGLAEELRALAAKDPQGMTYAYVMIQGRMTRPEKVAALERLGVRILGVHTWQSYVTALPLAKPPRSPTSRSCAGSAMPAPSRSSSRRSRR
ncbi:MAG: hypothetical protein R3F30_05650 [Planctomycetota bacterium]